MTPRDGHSKSRVHSHRVLHVNLSFGEFWRQYFNNGDIAPTRREKQRSLTPHVVPAVASSGLRYQQHSNAMCLSSIGRMVQRGQPFALMLYWSTTYVDPKEYESREEGGNECERKRYLYSGDIVAEIANINNYPALSDLVVS